jgi:hypothetical protein
VNADSAGWPSRPEISRRLPGWARDMAGQYPAYEFAPCVVSRGRSVAAVRMRPGDGPRVVITSSSEDEMREALGLKPRKPT